MRRALLFLLFAPVAGAQVIPINFGSIGSQNSSLTASFNNLNGTAMNGQALLIDLVFNETIKVYGGPGGHTNLHANIFFDLSPAPFSGFTVAGSAVFLLAGGLEAPAYAFGNNGTGAYCYLFPSTLPIDLMGMRFSLTLPQFAGGEIGGANLQLLVRDGVFSTATVPETGSTVFLLALALIVCGAGRFCQRES